eukprot:TRINITY_DN2721_c0_g1_i7.p1 TRINITY_DN2721_c0_g1~~TRINITY_DN2721_c0_g1_i7.p1  ORF type:complete len:650 (-),score=80.33 TRINITY_DN2721_c0_g1_i7:310-2259(-)
MVTKSRLSPFANTKLKRERKDFRKMVDLKSSSRPNPRGRKILYRWFSVIDAELYQKKALLPVKKLKDSLLSNSEVRRTLYGFIVFEVAWTSVRGINYLNELQTDTSMALEAKLMKRWEFDSVEQASRCISSWFSGTPYERFLLQKYLDDISSRGEVFYDAQDDPLVDLTNDGENKFNSDYLGDGSPFGSLANFKLTGGSEYGTSSLHTPPPPSGPYKRRKVMKCASVGSEFDSVSEEHAEIVSSPRHSETSILTHSNDDNEATASDATHYRDVLILFRFNDRDLPFKLKQIITCDLRLLRLLEAGLPSWVIFLQSYPVFCNIYRPWMCPLARSLYVLISIITVLIGFYDLYKNVPVLKATASRLCGPLFNWIETWEMISRIKYLGTMLFLHNFEIAIRWSLMITRAMRSLFSALTEPIAMPLAELLGFLLPFWNMCLQTGAHFSSVIWVVAGSTSSVVVNLVGIILLPLWAIISVVWRIVMAVIYPLFCIAWEVLVAPIRLVLASASLIVWLFSSIFYLLKESWLSLSGIFQLASASESAVGAYDVPIWRSLWNDLFSQIFCAIRSIVYGFVAFFATCNRHRLSINNHMQEFLLRLSFLVHNSPVDSFLARMKHGGYDQSSRRRYPSNSSARPQYQQNREKTHKRGKES